MTNRESRTKLALLIAPWLKPAGSWWVQQMNTSSGVQSGSAAYGVHVSMPNAKQAGHTKPIGPILQALGFKWIERKADHAILCVPRWIPKSWIKEAAARVRDNDDYRLLYGKKARVTVGNHVVRFDWWTER